MKNLKEQFQFTSGKHLWFSVALLIAMLLSSYAFITRLGIEKETRGAVIVADGSRFYQLAETKGRGDTVTAMRNAGIGAFFVPEYTGQDLVDGALTGVTLPALFVLPKEAGQGDWTVLSITNPDLVAKAESFLSRRFQGVLKSVKGNTTFFYLPLDRRQALKAGLLPDFPLLEALRNRSISAIYRPMPYGDGDVSSLINSLSWLIDQYSQIRVISPGGDVVAGSPQNEPFAAFIKNRHLLLAQPEFSTQVGASSQWMATFPNIVSLHAVTDDEVITRKINRSTMLARLERAAKERSVHFLVLRPDVLRGVSQRLSSYLAETAQLRRDLDAAGLTAEWPHQWPVASKAATFFASLGLGLLFVALALKHLARYWTWMTQAKRLPVAGAILAVFWGLLVWKVGFVTRLTGAFTTGLLATEATLDALDSYDKPFTGLLKAVIMVIFGGSVVAAYFGRPWYMARLAPFSGVKLTLILPFVLVFLHDLTMGEHPEKPGAILRRSALWGELVLLGVLMLAALVLLVRSGNTSFVPHFETVFRSGLERLLTARPRTKEIWVGYPALVIWYYLKRCGLWHHYREVLRLAATLAFSSAVNSFCHFHTPIILTIKRVVNGWWVGGLLGLVMLLILHWILRRKQRYIA